MASPYRRYKLLTEGLIPHLSPIRLLMFQQQEADAIAERVRQHFNGQ